MPDDTGGIKIIDIKDKYNPYIVQYIPILGCKYIYLSYDNRYAFAESDVEFFILNT